MAKPSWAAMLRAIQQPDCNPDSILEIDVKTIPQDGQLKSKADRIMRSANSPMKMSRVLALLSIRKRRQTLRSLAAAANEQSDTTNFRAALLMSIELIQVSFINYFSQATAVSDKRASDALASICRLADLLEAHIDRLLVFRDMCLALFAAAETSNSDVAHESAVAYATVYARMVAMTDFSDQLSDFGLTPEMLTILGAAVPHDTQTRGWLAHNASFQIARQVVVSALADQDEARLNGFGGLREMIDAQRGKLWPVSLVSPPPPTLSPQPARDSPQPAGFAPMPVGRKLLIIDINKMLLHRVHKEDLENFPTRPKHLAHITAQYHIFLRPYANVFLEFVLPPTNKT
jgi:hypothetical protein